MANPAKARAMAAGVGMTLAPKYQAELWDFLPPILKGRALDYFAYVAEFLPLGSNATVTTDISITADADFVIIAGTRVVTDVANTAFVANVPELVTIIDAGSGRQLSDRAVHMDNYFGTAQLPAYWPVPKFIRAASTLSTRIQNLEAVNRNVRLAYHGFKVFGFRW